MLNTLKNATAALALMTFGAFAAPVVVSSIEVEADLEALNVTSADQYISKVSEDLKAAITEKLAGRAGVDGLTVKVSVRDIGIDHMANMMDFEKMNTLGGVVSIIDKDMNPLNSFAVNLSAVATESATPVEGLIILEPSGEDIYAELVAAFATKVDAEVGSLDQ